MSVSQGEHVSQSVLVVIFAHDDSRFRIGVDFGQASDVNEKAIVNADESGIDDLGRQVRMRTPKEPIDPGYSLRLRRHHGPFAMPKN